MRLKAIAQVRAQTIAVRISPRARQPGQPRLSRAATVIAANANGRANSVCEKRTNDAHLWIKENIWHSASKAGQQVPWPGEKTILIRLSLSIHFLSPSRRQVMLHAH